MSSSHATRLTPHRQVRNLSANTYDKPPLQGRFSYHLCIGRSQTSLRRIATLIIYYMQKVTKLNSTKMVRKKKKQQAGNQKFARLKV